MEYQFRRLVSSIHTIDKIHGPVQWKRPDMEASMEHQFNISTYRWHNAYGNHDFDVRNAVYSDEFSGGRTYKHLSRSSPDRLLPVYVSANTPHGPHLHHPDNVAMTFQALNYARGTDILHKVPWYKRMLSLRESVADLRCQVDYHEEIQGQCVAFERAADNALLIRFSLPYGNSARLKNVPDDFDEIWAPKHKSGVWDSVIRSRFLTRHNLINSMPRRRRHGIVAPFPDFRMWNEKELDDDEDECGDEDEDGDDEEDNEGEEVGVQRL